MDPAALAQAAAAAAAVIVAAPAHEAGAVCAARQRMLTSPAPPPLHDATVFTDRYEARLHVLDVVKGPPRPRSQAGATAPFDVTIAVALRESGPTMVDAGAPYDEAACEAVDALLAHPYVVVFARGVYVDRGNSLPQPWDGLGTDPLTPNRGFDTLEAARAYVAPLRPAGAR